MDISFTQLLMYFFIYAFVGWAIEVIYHTVTSGKFVNRGFLNGPWCPIYGVSFAVVIMLLTPLQENLAILFCGSFVLATAMEFVTGFVLEKIFNDKWWDYSEEPFNIMGYVCLKFSLMWGLACTFVMRIIHPLISALVINLPEFVLNLSDCIFVIAFVADLTFTVVAIRNLRYKVKISKEIAERLKYISDHIGEDISDATVNVMEKTMEIQEDIAYSKLKRKDRQEKLRQKFNAELEELKEKYQVYLDRRSYTQRRLDKAFPRLDFERRNENGETLKERIKEAIEKYKSR